MRLLVTGLSGFVGRELLSLINHHDIVAFGRQNVLEGFNGEFHSVDLNDHKRVRQTVSKLKLDACIHLAWQDIPNFDVDTCLKNFYNSVNLAASLAEANCSKVIVTGTCLEYNGLVGPCNENQLGSDLELFGRFKHSVNLIWEKLQSGLGYHWIRPFYIYGKDQRRDSLLPHIIRSYKMNNIPNLSNSNGCNDYVHVNDVARLIAHLLECDAASGTINAGSGALFRNSDISEYVGMLAKNDNASRQYRFPKPSIDDGFYADMTFAKDIGFENKVMFEDGIRAMYGLTVL